MWHSWQCPGTEGSHYRDQPGYQSQVRDRACARGSAGLGPSGGSTGPVGSTPGERGRTALPLGLLRAPDGHGGRALPDILEDSGTVLPVVAAHRDTAQQPVEAALAGEKAGAWRAVVAEGRPEPLRSAAQAHPAIPVKPAGHARTLILTNQRRLLPIFQEANQPAQSILTRLG